MEDEESVLLVSVAPVTAAARIGNCVSVACQCKAIQTSNDSTAEIESFFEERIISKGLATKIT
jgi:hypothetical protein